MYLGKVGIPVGVVGSDHSLRLNLWLGPLSVVRLVIPPYFPVGKYRQCFCRSGRMTFHRLCALVKQTLPCSNQVKVHAGSL